MVCTSFVGINKGTNQRGVLTPYGREDLDFVSWGNSMMERCLGFTGEDSGRLDPNDTYYVEI